MEIGSGETDRKLDLKDALRRSLSEFHRTHRISKGREHKQQLIISSLPNNSDMEIRGALARSADGGFNKGSEAAVTGTLFELLVQNDTSICYSESENAKRLRTLLVNPGIFGLGSLYPSENKYNPDFLGLTDANLITKVVEAKAGRLDFRAINQLSKFKENLKISINQLRNIPGPLISANGLGFVRENGGIKFGDNLRVTLAVPLFAFEGDFTELLSPKAFKRKRDVDWAVSVLRDCDIRHTIFTRGELHNMVQALTPALFGNRNWDTQSPESRGQKPS